MSDLREIGQRGAARITERVGPYLQKVPAEHRGLLIALLERNAARRYRTWAAEVSDADERDGLEACASREEEVAEKAVGSSLERRESRSRSRRIFRISLLRTTRPSASSLDRSRWRFRRRRSVRGPRSGERSPRARAMRQPRAFSRSAHGSKR